MLSDRSVPPTPFALMLYADAARRFNFLAGLGIGAILGAGLAMLAAPQKRVRFRNLAGHAEAGLARGKAVVRRSRR